jgi:hypothetical protein
MPILSKYTQQPAEVIDYAVDFGPWVRDRNDNVVAFEALADPGLDIEASRQDDVVRVVASGGSSGTRYKVTVRASTAGGLVREVEFLVTVKET